MLFAIFAVSDTFVQLTQNETTQNETTPLRHVFITDFIYLCDMYIPPFTVSATAINLIAEISAQIERYAIRLEQEDGLRLRKANRIKTIHSSLAIEGNTLSEDQVRDIINGKSVVAPIKQIQEVKNAIQTYEMYPTTSLNSSTRS